MAASIEEYLGIYSPVFGLVTQIPLLKSYILLKKRLHSLATATPMKGANFSIIFFADCETGSLLIKAKVPKLPAIADPTAIL